MKIDHSSKIGPIIEPAKEQTKTKNLGGNSDFASVLKEVALEGQDNNLSVNALNPTARASALEYKLNQLSGHEHTASKLIDTLEEYQRMLADPGANLKQVQPLVEQMKAKAVVSAPLIEEMPDGHGLKRVMKEALIQMNKEIVRFERGEYIDG